MDEDLKSCDRDHPARPGRCAVGQHQWVDRVEDGRKKVVCCVPKCGALYGFYESEKSPSCLKSIRGT